MATFKDRLFGQHVPKEIIDRFDALQLGKSNAPLESVSKPYSHNLGESTAFARMWTAVDVVTQGQLGPDGEMVKQNTDGDWYYIVKSTGDAAIIPDYDPTEEVHNIQIYSINENREKSYTDNPLDFEFGDGNELLPKIQKQEKEQEKIKQTQGWGAWDQTKLKFAPHKLTLQEYLAEKEKKFKTPDTPLS